MTETIASLDSVAQATAFIDAVLALSIPLHSAIASFDESAAHYNIAAEPGVAWFERDAGDTIRHVSNSPAPEILGVLETLRERHLEAVGLSSDSDNSHLIPLLLLCCCIVDETTSTRFGLAEKARREVSLLALDTEHAKHDPQIAPHDSALRAWVPLVADHAPDAGAHTAVLELQFLEKRQARYAPW